MSAFTKTLIVSNQLRNPLFQGASNWAYDPDWSITSGYAECTINTTSPAILYQTGHSFGDQQADKTYRVRYRVRDGITPAGTLSVEFYDD